MSPFLDSKRYRIYKPPYLFDYSILICLGRGYTSIQQNCSRQFAAGRNVLFLNGTVCFLMKYFCLIAKQNVLFEESNMYVHLLSHTGCSPKAPWMERGIGRIWITGIITLVRNFQRSLIIVKPEKSSFETFQKITFYAKNAW